MRNKRLLAARQALSLKQWEVAERAGISRSHYTKLEAGERVPSLRVAERVAKALNAKPDELFFDSTGDKAYPFESVGA